MCQRNRGRSDNLPSQYVYQSLRDGDNTATHVPFLTGGFRDISEGRSGELLKSLCFFRCFVRFRGEAGPASGWTAASSSPLESSWTTRLSEPLACRKYTQSTNQYTVAKACLCDQSLSVNEPSLKRCCELTVALSLLMLLELPSS